MMKDVKAQDVRDTAPERNPSAAHSCAARDDSGVPMPVSAAPLPKD